MEKNNLKIDIGGGRNAENGFKTLDMIEESDFICNLEKDRFPFEDESVSEFKTNHTFEHIDNIIHVFNEVWRTLQWDGKITIKVPNKDCILAWQDPTHKRFWTTESFKFFCGEYLKKYKLDYGIKCCFKIESIESYAGKTSNPLGKKYFEEIKVVLIKEQDHYKKVGYPIIKKEKIKKDRPEEFEEIIKELKEIFTKKNKDYGDGYFTGGYSAAERWMSIKRKVARLETFYKKGSLELKDETIDDTWKDLAIYSIMELMKRSNDDLQK